MLHWFSHLPSLIVVIACLIWFDCNTLINLLWRFSAQNSCFCDYFTISSYYALFNLFFISHRFLKTPYHSNSQKPTANHIICIWWKELLKFTDKLVEQASLILSIIVAVSSFLTTQITSFEPFCYLEDATHICFLIASNVLHMVLLLQWPCFHIIVCLTFSFFTYLQIDGTEQYWKWIMISSESNIKEGNTGIQSIWQKQQRKIKSPQVEYFREAL